MIDKNKILSEAKKKRLTKIKFFGEEIGFLMLSIVQADTFFKGNDFDRAKIIQEVLVDPETLDPIFKFEELCQFDSKSLAEEIIKNLPKLDDIEKN